MNPEIQQNKDGGSHRTIVNVDIHVKILPAATDYNFHADYREQETNESYDTYYAVQEISLRVQNEQFLEEKGLILHDTEKEV